MLPHIDAHLCECKMLCVAAASRGGHTSISATPNLLKDSGRFQSGLLSLASLHTKFGHIDRALMALQEMIRISQQHADAAMLAHALAGLAALLRRTPLGPHGQVGVHQQLQLTAAHHAQVQLLLRR